MAHIEQELRQLEEFMKEIIDKAPAMMEQMKRIAEIAKGIRFVDEGEGDSALLSGWGELARLARIHKFRVAVTTAKGGRVGRFVDAGSLDGDMFGVLEIYDGTQSRIYHKDITAMEFLDNDATPPEPERWEWRMDDAGFLKLYCGDDVLIYAHNMKPSMTPDQRRVVAAAPRMRDALRMVLDHMAVLSIDGKRQCLMPDGDWHEVMGALEKAGG